MNNSTKVRSLTVEISYPHPDTLSDSFRVYVCKNSDGKWLNTVLILSRGDANPMEYFSDTYNGLLEFLSEEGFEITNLNIYLDLMEFYGIKVPFLFRWDIKNRDKPIRSQIEVVDQKQLSNNDRKVLESYYKSRWSIFTESCLTNEDKAELIASALANSVYDEYSVESVQSSIRYKLDEAIRKGLRIDRIHEYMNSH